MHSNVEGMSDEDVLGQHLQELRRGTVVLAALTSLATPHYGYALLARLEDAGFAVEGNTLYPLLRRLEKQGLLTSRWDVDQPRPRKFYVVTEAGCDVLTRLQSEWRSLDKAVSGLGGHER
jgi:DNA-binding PadR family transcriptional regulator